MFDSRVSVGPIATSEKENNTQQELSSSIPCASSQEKHKVVGRCIDCTGPHDVYSGFIVCTVCRMPVLVCPQCVSENKHPGEYYCSRHRDMKDIYFTVLDRFSLSELRSQYEQLEAMLQLCYEQHNKKVFPKIKLDESLSADMNDLSVQEEKVSSASEPKNLTTASKNRRRTIRKQMSRIQERIKVLQDTQASSNTTMEEGKNELRIDAEETMLVNPKVKDGWGFWRS